MKFKGYLFLIFCSSTVSAFLYPIIRFPEKFITRDWGLFNSFSLFSRACWRHYNKIPLHNPYVFGGMDFPANPQSKAFSPLAIFDVLFTAPLANLYSLVFMGVVGSFGMYYLLKYLNVGKVVSILISILFIHASWFHLHYAEGHVIFGSFMLFAWALYFMLRLAENKYKLSYAALSAFMMLDGGMYAFIYCQLMLLFVYVFRVNGVRFKQLFIGSKYGVLYVFLSGIVFVLLSSMKLLPMLILHGNRAPILENINLNYTSVFHAFFNPNAFIHLKILNGNYLDFVRYHEVGSYIGGLTFLVVTYFLIKSWSRKLLGYCLMILFFFWVGTGWFDPINPWRIFQQLPIISNAHIQTRALFIVYFFAIILLAFSLESLFVKKKTLAIIVVCLLMLEGLFLSNYPYIKVYEYEESVMATSDFPKGIFNTKVDKTHASPISYGWGFHFEHYNTINAATKGFMDPSFIDTDVKSITDKGYKGEAYFLEGKGDVNILSYTPGELVINCNIEESGVVQINTNYLLGWNTEAEGVEVFSKGGLLSLKVSQGVNTVHVYYTHWYFYLTFSLFVLGITLTIILLRWNRKTNVMKQMLD